MNKLPSIFKSICAIALIAMAAGCATSHPDRDKTAIAAGFKIVTPTTPEQKALYAKLPQDSVTPVKYKGGLYYMMRDSSNGMVLVGNSAQYSVYQEMRYHQRMNNEDLREAQIDEMNNVDWGAWGGGGAAFVGGFAP
ncbi:hypothetical protein [Variovorax saccharolyticus]|uniref:hypothetical protein n=1 Tax=Variovorax saccharolyticus TaxID=3053516 RepID=UPI002575692A|nr:hypothetical protein [Variovorax sp. J31P216]MDM0026331.1 hypothetical protein [Variovorax sp. J31P216]